MLFSRLNPSGQMRLTGQASNSNSGAPAMDELRGNIKLRDGGWGLGSNCSSVLTIKTMCGKSPILPELLSSAVNQHWAI